MKHAALAIVGPTATGKTALALHVAKKYKGGLISMDSRQVFMGMNIGTGKDIPTNAQPISKSLASGKIAQGYLINTTELWLVDQVTPDDDWSVSQHVNLAREIAEELIGQGMLPILVGGTGLYIRSFFNPPASMDQKPNEALRVKLGSLSVEQLQSELTKLDPTKLEHMNDSDQANPRRLVRAIELASDIERPAIALEPFEGKKLTIGLNIDLPTLEQHIQSRVHKRMLQGMCTEVQTLLQTYHQDLPAMSATGYKEVIELLNKNIDQNEAERRWTTRELQYAKRQLTWFKKEKNIIWFNSTNPDLIPEVEKLVDSWYDGLTHDNT